MPSKSTTPPTIVYTEAPCPRADLKGPCRIYSRGKCAGGYGAVTVLGKKWLVHRYVWELANGPIPKGLVIDHQCMVRACCNVDHMRIVTRKINSTENSGAVGAINKLKTHCPRGHPLSGDNLRIAVWKNNARVCKTCARAAQLSWYKNGRKGTMNDTFNMWKCPHCFDTGRMAIGEGMDAADCTYCQSNSFSCDGCTYEGCPGCHGKVKPRKISNAMKNVLLNGSRSGQAMKALRAAGAIDEHGELTKAGRYLADYI